MSIQITWVLLYICLKFSIDSTVFQRYTKIELVYDKIIGIRDNIIQHLKTFFI